ncbi:MAG: glycosyltransferase family 2 protein [Bacteroidales bacterium]
MENNYFVTIVTVCDNAEAIVERTIKSVISQTYKNIEYIIVDGKSTDETVVIAKRYQTLYPHIISVYSEKDAGIYDAMNKALKIAKGDFILYMNAGDLFYDENVVGKCFSNKSINENTSAIFGDCCDIGNNKKLKYMKAKPFFLNKKKQLHYGFSHQSIFFRIDKAQENPYDLRYKVASDYDCIKRIYETNPNFLYVPIPISIYETDNGFSAKNRGLALREVIKITGYNKFILLYLLPKIFIKKQIKTFLQTLNLID